MDLVKTNELNPSVLIIRYVVGNTTEYFLLVSLYSRCDVDALNKAWQVCHLYTTVSFVVN